MDLNEQNDDKFSVVIYSVDNIRLQIVFTYLYGIHDVISLSTDEQLIYVPSHKI